MLNRSDKAEEVEAVSAQLSQTNVVGNIHIFHLFLPLVLKGKVKKVIAISTGMADIDLVNDCDVDIGALYAASKAAMNVIVAKFNVQYKKDGVLFMSISPGLVDVGRYADGTYPFLSCIQDYTFINEYSYSGRNPGHDRIHGQGCDLLPSLQRPNHAGRIRPTCQIDLGEGQY